MPTPEETALTLPEDRLRQFNPNERLVLELLFENKALGGLVARVGYSVNNSGVLEEQRINIFETVASLHARTHKILQQQYETFRNVAFLLGIDATRFKELTLWLLENEINI